MNDRTLSAADLSRLGRERDAADRQYNAALTALDRSILAIPEIPQPPQPLVTAALDSLQRLADKSVTPPDLGSGWRGWARRLIWSMLAPPLARQERINHALITHLTQAASVQRQSTEAIETMLTLLGGELEAMRTFQSRLVVWAQQVTPYVDTKDRETTGLIRRVNENPVRLLERTIGLLQQRQIAMKRELERLVEASPADATGDTPRGTAEVSATTSPVDAYKYVGFEHAFRGSETDVAQRLEGYCIRFDSASDVLDVGCGRGEFLRMLRERGVTGRGLDANREMVAICRDRGLDVNEGDAVSHLRSLPDNSIGGLIATQVVEHFRSDYLLAFIEQAYLKLRPGSTIVLETLNVDSWSAFFGPYLRDLSHERAIPSETLTFLLQASGFQHVEIKSSSPVDEATKLQRIPVHVAGPESRGTELTSLIAAFNDNVDRLNGLLFSHLDYTAVAERM